MIAQIMKRLILLIAAIWSVSVCLSAQGFGYSYGAGREDVQVQTPMAAAGADRPEDIWAVSGNMQPFGTCANNADTPPMALRMQDDANRLLRAVLILPTRIYGKISLSAIWIGYVGCCWEDT